MSDSVYVVLKTENHYGSYIVGVFDSLQNAENGAEDTMVRIGYEWESAKVRDSRMEKAWKCKKLKCDRIEIERWALNELRPY